MTIEEFFNACKGFDWFYAMSDDHRAWQRGSIGERKLKNEAKTDPTKQMMYEHWHNYMFSGDPWGTAKAPEPKLKDYIDFEEVCRGRGC